jgi:hypothetical protein
MARRILRRIRLDKIAAVDDPCQQYATVGIVKRAPTATAIAKATFEETLEAQMVSDRVSEAFYRAFDGLYARNNAFRAALTDEIADNGDGSAASEAYLGSVRALVDEAVSAARNVGAGATDEAIEKAIETVLDAKFSPEEKVMKITDKAGLRAEIEKFDPAKSPAAHIAIIQKAATDLGAEDELPAEGLLAKAKSDPALAKAQRQIAVLELPAAVRKHFDGLDEAGQNDFLAKSADERAAIVAKANEGDPVVYTTKSGIEVRKSEGAATLALAKQTDAQAAQIEALTGDSFEKRAASEFPNVAKSTAVTLLKSAQTVGLDSDAGKGLIESLSTMNKAADPMFKRIGSSDPGTTVAPSLAKARETFRGKVEEIASRDKIAKSVAMERAETEFPELFAEAYPPQEPAEVDA